MSMTKYTDEHEWLRVEDNGEVTVGITNYAQEQLGDVVFVELPEEGAQLNSGDEAAVVESVKAAGEVKSPLVGEVVAVNSRLTDEPELVNKDAEMEGWFFRLKIEDPAELDSLMDESAYREFLDTL